ncbi:MAG: hypothetical protein KDC02_14450 [Flavobacteriales bacterium]|nr:hypothetical protein [Flavobacteriales bacterium]
MNRVLYVVVFVGLVAATQWLISVFDWSGIPAMALRLGVPMVLTPALVGAVRDLMDGR